MSSPIQTKAKLETAKSSDHTGISGTYTNLGTPLEFAALALVIASTLNQSVWISTDASNDKILVPSGGFLMVPLAPLSPEARFGLAKSTQLSIKQGPDGAPSSGDISITPIYGDN